MSQVSSLQRTTSDISTLVHENFVNEVKPWLDKISPLAGIFSELGPGGYTLVGEKLVFAADALYAGMAMATDGYLPNHQSVNPVNLETTPTRIYIRRAVDNFLQALAQKPGAFEDFMGRVMKQMWDAFERATIRHVHGSSAATICLASAAPSGSTLVVKDGYGHTGTAPAMFLEPGMWVAVLDASASYATLGAYEISSIDYSTSSTTATITFTSAPSATIAAGDPLVFATSKTTGDSHFVTERNRAPLGLIDIIDPNEANTSYLTVTESSYPRVKPVRRASSDWGAVELIEFLDEIAAKSNSPVTAESHVVTMQQGAKTELAKTLLPFQQQSELGGELNGGWKTVRVAGYDIVADPYHLHNVVYALCKEDLHVVDLDGEPGIWAEDGSQFSRIADYDGKEWFARHYVQRFASRRNRCGALTGVTNTNHDRYNPQPS